jgi:hypothetical protein
MDSSLSQAVTRTCLGASSQWVDATSPRSWSTVGRSVPGARLQASLWTSCRRFSRTENLCRAPSTSLPAWTLCDTRALVPVLVAACALPTTTPAHPSSQHTLGVSALALVLLNTVHQCTISLTRPRAHVHMHTHTHTHTHLKITAHTADVQQPPPPPFLIR